MQFLAQVSELNAHCGTYCVVKSSYLDNFGFQYGKDFSVLQLANIEEVLIFGDDWLNKYKAHMDYESKTCVIQKGKQKNSLQAKSLTHWAPKSSTKCLSTMQFKRAVRKGAMPILFQLTKVDDEETSSQLVDTWRLATLLEKFKDVFEPLQTGLTP